MQLRALIRNFKTLSVAGPLRAEVPALACDPRRVVPGAVYFALPRAANDGQEQIEKAIQRGARAVVCRQNGSIKQRATRIEVANPAIALAEGAAAFYGHPGRDLLLVGLRGRAAWKPASLLRQMMEHSGLSTGLISSMGHQIGSRSLPQTEFFPDSLDVQHMLGLMKRGRLHACVIQLPEDFTEEHVTGLPLDFFVDLGEQAASAEQQRQIQVSAHGKSLQTWRIAPAAGGKEVTSRLLDENEQAAEVTLAQCVFAPEGVSFFFDGRRRQAGLPGASNAAHFADALNIALKMGLEKGQLTRNFTKLTPPPSSLERVSGRTFVHYAPELRDLESALDSIDRWREAQGGRILGLLGASAETSRERRLQMGKIMGRFCDHVILTADNPDRESVIDLSAPMAAGLVESGAGFHLQPCRAQAVRELVSLARPNDFAVVFGTGEKKSQHIGGAIIPFDDKEEALAALQLTRVGAQTRQLLNLEF